MRESVSWVLIWFSYLTVQARYCHLVLFWGWGGEFVFLLLLIIVMVLTLEFVLGTRGLTLTLLHV